MGFDIDEHAHAVVKAHNSGERINHMWLHGMYHLTHNTVLDYEHIQEYMQQTLEEYPPFTKFKSAVQMFKLMEACLQDAFSDDDPISLQDMPLVTQTTPDFSQIAQRFNQQLHAVDPFYIHLPITDAYHLEFPMLKGDGGLYTFIYTTCTRCKGLEEHGFPEMTFRSSIDFGKNVPDMYDNRCLPDTIETVTTSYTAIEDFVTSTKIG